MADEGIDQEVFDREIAAGKPERVARALAKSAFVRKQKAASAPAAAPAETPATAAATVPKLTPEERAARVAAATGVKAGNGGGRGKGVGETHRLLAMVPPAGIQRVEKRQEDKVNVWPHLLAEEFLSFVVVL